MEIFHSSKRVGFGADGVAVDGKGNLYANIIEDELIVVSMDMPWEDPNTVCQYENPRAVYNFSYST